MANQGPLPVHVMAERSDWSGARNDITTSQSDSEDGDHSSDVDYSPGRLVIDTGMGKLCVEVERGG